MSKTDLPAVEELQRRLAQAASLTQKIEPDRIADAVFRWCRLLGAAGKTRIIFISTLAELKEATKKAFSHERATWATRGFRDATPGCRVGEAVSAAQMAWQKTAAFAAMRAWNLLAFHHGFSKSTAWFNRDTWRIFEAYSASETTIGGVGYKDHIARAWLPVLEAFEAGAFLLIPTETEVFVAPIPKKAMLDDRLRLHCADGPAIVWLDDITEFCWRDVIVEPRVVLNPESITRSDIANEKNVNGKVF
jgi:hypothetical protein